MPFLGSLLCALAVQWHLSLCLVGYCLFQSSMQVQVIFRLSASQWWFFFQPLLHIYSLMLKGFREPRADFQGALCPILCLQILATSASVNSDLCLLSWTRPPALLGSFPCTRVQGLPSEAQSHRSHLPPSGSQCCTSWCCTTLVPS